jgi:hypothetical protein
VPLKHLELLLLQTIFYFGIPFLEKCDQSVLLRHRTLKLRKWGNNSCSCFTADFGPKVLISSEKHKTKFTCYYLLKRKPLWNLEQKDQFNQLLLLLPVFVFHLSKPRTSYANS